MSKQKYENRQTDRQTHRHTDRQTDRHTHTDTSGRDRYKTD